MTKVYRPKDEQILTWDPENMALYWRQCKLYDSHPLDASQFAGATDWVKKSQQQIPKGAKTEPFQPS